MQSISKPLALLLFSLVCTISYAQHDIHQGTSEGDSLYKEAKSLLESLQQNPSIQSSSRTAGDEYYQLNDTAYTYHFTAVNDSVLVRKVSREYDDNLKYSSYTDFIKDDIWRPSYKVFYKINEYGNNVYYLAQKWDATINDLRNSFKYDYNYNEKGQDTLIIRYLWDTETDQWKYNWKFESAYNDEGQQVNHTKLKYDLSLQQWIPQSGYKMIYKNGLIKERYNVKNNGAGEQESGTYNSYFYDTHNNVVLDSIFYYNSTSQAYEFRFYKGSKLIYENDLVMIQYDSSVDDTGTASNYHRIHYSYHINKEIFSRMDSIYGWNSEISAFEWMLRTQMEYDEAGRRTKFINVGYTKEIWQFTEAGTLKLYEYYIWDKALKYWIGQTKRENKFSSDNKILLTKIYRSWGWNETDWNDFPQYIDYYNYISVGINRKEIAVCDYHTIPRDTVYQANDSLKLVIYQTREILSIPEITFNGDTLITTAYTGAVYNWIDCNTGNIIFAGDNKYYFGRSGSYKVEVELDDCRKESVCIDATVTSTASEILQEVMIYPNPFTDLLSFGYQPDKYNQLMVISPEGKVIYSAPLDPGNGTVNLNFLKNGVYIIKLTGNENIYSKKVIKE